MSEEWRVIPQFPCYSASSLGRIMRNCDGMHSKKGKIIKAHFSGGRYWSVPIFNENGKSTRNIHTLICEAFHGVKEKESHQVRHLDGNSSNNIPSNLRWGTAKENAADRFRHGRTAFGPKADTSKIARGEDNKGGNKLKNDQVVAIFLDKRSRPKIAADYNVSITVIRYIHIRRNWRHVTENLER